MLFIYVESLFSVWLLLYMCENDSDNDNDTGTMNTMAMAAAAVVVVTKSAMSMIKCKRDEFINQLSRVSESDMEMCYHLRVNH